MENGTVVEGGDDYTKEELEEIKKTTKSKYTREMKCPI